MIYTSSFFATLRPLNGYYASVKVHKYLTQENQFIYTSFLTFLRQKNPLLTKRTNHYFKELDNSKL